MRQEATPKLKIKDFQLMSIVTSLLDCIFLIRVLKSPSLFWPCNFSRRIGCRGIMSSGLDGRLCESSLPLSSRDDSSPIHLQIKPRQSNPGFSEHYFWKQFIFVIGSAHRDSLSIVTAHTWVHETGLWCIRVRPWRRVIHQTLGFIVCSLRG